VTARQLKNNTGETLRRVCHGENLTITNRGTPIAVILPFSAAPTTQKPAVRPFEEAWTDILQTLAHPRGRQSSWRALLRRSRRRT